MKKQALFSLKDKRKKLKCRLLQFLFGALRVKVNGLHLQGTQLCHFNFSFTYQRSTLEGKMFTNEGENSSLQE